MAKGLFTLTQQIQALRQGAWDGYTPPAVEYLVVGGGQTVGSQTGGGGGGMLQGVVPVFKGQTILATVGGAATNSSFGSMVAFAGGGTPAGSGAGGYNGPNTNTIRQGQQGTYGQGNAGGYGQDTGAAYYGGGGGGAGAPGTGPLGGCGDGGNGLASTLSGLATYGGGGGGGHAYGGTPGFGGVGGGGGSLVSGTDGVNGATNTGGGGGASSYGPPYGTGGTGGSGIVAISYPIFYGAPTSTTGSPNVMISGSGSIYFNGKNSAIYPFSQGYLSSSDFTIEAWVYPTVAQTSGLILIGQGDLGTAAGSSYYFSVGSAGDCSVYVGGTTYTITAPNPSTGQWSHVALVRSGNTLSSYRNGTRIGTGSVTGTVNNGTATYYPSSGGISNVGGGANFTGYMSNLRRIVGSGGYNAASATITVPTAPLTATANTTLLVFQDGYSPFKDASTAATPMSSLYNRYSANTVPRGTFLTPFDSSTYTNIARVYEWTSSGSITF
jgi:hypothetical protein